MSIFGVFSSLADGSFIDDIEKGLEQFENFVGEGEQKLNSVVDTADAALQNVVDGAEKVANVTDVVASKLEK